MVALNATAKQFMTISTMKIIDIPIDNKYDGFLWMSNSKEPIELDREALPASFGKDCNPFVVEGELWDSDNKRSYSIHQAGNITVCQKFDVNDSDFNDINVDDRVYASHRMKHHGLHFLEYWEPTVSEACLGMKSLEMKKRVFVGFKDKED